MQPKTLKFLLIIFIGLISLIGFKLYLPKLQQKPSLYQEKIKNIDKNSISTIKITKENQTVTITKKDNFWKINDKKADKSNVNSLLSGLFSRDNELVSKTNRQHQNLELTEEKATKIKLDDKLTFLVGKSAVGGLYLRFADSDPVFLANNLSTSNISTDVEDWYDKTIVEIAPSKIKKLTFEKPQEKFTVVKDEKGNWKFEKEDKKVNEEKISSIINTFSFLTAKSLASQEAVAKYPKTAQLTLTVEYEGGKETLKFFAGNNEEYLTKRASDEENFILSKTSTETFLVSSKDLAEETK